MRSLASGIYRISLDSSHEVQSIANVPSPEESNEEVRLVARVEDYTSPSSQLTQFLTIL